MSSTPVWEWKREAESPSSLASGLDEVNEDVWLFGEGVSFVVEQDEDERLSQPVTRAQVAAKLLEDLDEMVKEEPFSDFSEARIDLPIFEDLPIIDLCPKYKSLDTETLLQEFDYVYGEVEFNNGSLLTPPQSPPYHHHQQQQQHQDVSFLPHLSPKDLDFPVVNHEDIVFFNTLSGVPQKSGHHVDDLIVLDISGKSYQDEIPATSHSQDVATELAVVDELLRTRAEDMDVSSDPWESSNASGSTNDSESEFAPSPAGSSSDNSNSGDVSNDPEWIPEAVNAPKAPKASASTSTAAKRRRGKPYGRPVEDKKLRKKEQNKNAATRYRQKKKQEVEVILDEEKIMEDKNEDLKEKVTDLQREIRYLKGLMRDLFKAKGMLK